MRSSPPVSNAPPRDEAATLLTAIADARGVLLRVGREVAPGPAGARCSTALSLGFDQAGLEVTAQSGALLAAASGQQEPPRFLDANEEDPWWSILGAPLVRVDARDDGSLLLQFRADEDSPKILVLSAEEAGVSVRSLV